MLERLKQIIVQYVEIEPAEITEQTSLRADLGMNSLELINLVVQVEDEFNVDIHEKDAMDFQVLGDVVAYLNCKSAQ